MTVLDPLCAAYERMYRNPVAMPPPCRFPRHTKGLEKGFSSLSVVLCRVVL